MTDDERKHECFMQSVKLYFELLKHVTTLSTGTILVLFALMKTQADPATTPASVKAAAVSLVLAIVFSLMGMLIVVRSSRTSGELTVTEFKSGQVAAICTLLCFLTGILSAVVAIAAN